MRHEISTMAEMMPKCPFSLYTICIEDFKAMICICPDQRMIGDGVTEFIIEQLCRSFWHALSEAFRSQTRFPMRRSHCVSAMKKTDRVKTLSACRTASLTVDKRKMGKGHVVIEQCQCCAPPK